MPTLANRIAEREAGRAGAFGTWEAARLGSSGEILHHWSPRGAASAVDGRRDLRAAHAALSCKMKAGEQMVNVVARSRRRNAGHRIVAVG